MVSQEAFPAFMSRGFFDCWHARATIVLQDFLPQNLTKLEDSVTYTDTGHQQNPQVTMAKREIRQGIRPWSASVHAMAI